MTNHRNSKIILSGYHRHDIVKLLPKKSGMIGVELGVAEGLFSKKMIETGLFDNFFGVDRYQDHHNVDEYKRALISIGLRSQYKLLRMSFEQALELFPDNSLDFVYIDGYAHTGQECGTTIYSWFNKVKVGGVLAGDDYHDDWPLVIKAVRNFVETVKLDLYLTDVTGPMINNNYPSWGVIKKTNESFAVPQSLIDECEAVSKKIESQVNRKYFKKLLVNEYIKPIVPNWVVSLWRTLRKYRP